MNADAMLNFLFGYRAVYCMWVLLQEIMASEANAGPISPLGLGLADEIANAYEVMTDEKITIPEVVNHVSAFRNTITYMHYDATNTYPKLYRETNSTLRIFRRTHDMPDSVLRAYILSMDELHAVSNVCLDKLKSYVEDKPVLDFGCGAGYYIPQLVNAGARHVIGYDRHDIIRIAKTVKRDCSENKYHFLCRQLEGVDSHLRYYFGAIWFSEVLHGKMNQEQFLADLASYLMDGGYFIINHVLRESMRGLFFKLHMCIHTGNENIECNINVAKLKQLIESNSGGYRTLLPGPIIRVHTSNYHIADVYQVVKA